MYIMYRLSGYAKPIADNPNKARSRATVSMQLNRFKACIRGAISRLAADDTAKNMFCPIKITGGRFLSLGISGRQAAPAIIFSIDSNMQKSIADKLITLGHQISGKKLSDFKGGSMLLRPKPLILKGRVGWDSKLTPKIKPIPSCGEDRSESHARDVICRDDAKQAPLPTWYTCPACNAPRLSNSIIFQLRDLDNPVFCRSCKVSSKVGRWRCKCQLPWHLCTQHSFCCNNNDNTNSNRKQPPKQHNRGTKRIAFQSFDQLQAFDDKRAAKERRRNMTKSSSCHTPAHNILPPQSNILSQRLKERFAHLLTK